MRISKEWRFYRFLGASPVKRFSDTRYQALATYGIIDIWWKALRLLTPFPHGVMAAHGSLEPFVLVRVQVGELEGDMRRHVIMPPHIFYQIRSAVLSIIRFPRRRTSHRPYGTCAGWTVEYLAVGQANAVFFGYVRRGGYAGIPAFQHVSACEDPPLADQNRWHSVRARFGSYPDCVEACITCSPQSGYAHTCNAVSANITTPLLKITKSGEQESLAVMFRVSVEQFRDGTVFEHGADGAG